MEGGTSSLDKEVKRHLTQVLCILCAIAFWLYVTYTEDPEMQVWMRNIPVTYTGAEGLAERGLAFTERDEPAEINVKVEGRRSVLHRLLTSDIHATVDYGSIAGPGAHSLPVSVAIQQNDLRVAKLSFASVSCRTDTLVTVDKTVIITSSGAESLGIHNLTASPATVRVTGSESIMSRLEASVHIDLTSHTASDVYQVSLSDRSGNALLPDSVTMETDTVTISATRSLPVVLETTNLPDGSEIKEIVCNPETVDVRGELSALMSLESVPGAYKAWADFSVSPAQIGPTTLAYPAGVEPLGPSAASGEVYLK